MECGSDISFALRNLTHFDQTKMGETEVYNSISDPFNEINVAAGSGNRGPTSSESSELRVRNIFTSKTCLLLEKSSFWGKSHSFTSSGFQ